MERLKNLILLNWKKIVLGLGLILLLIFAFMIWTKIPKVGLPKEASARNCDFDDDCVVVGKIDPQNPCCNLLCEVEVISKQANTKRENWRIKNCEGSYISRCPIDECYMEKLPKSRCGDDKCAIEWVER